MILIDFGIEGSCHLHSENFVNGYFHGRTNDVARFVEMSSIDMPLIAEETMKMDDDFAFVVVADAALSSDEFGQMIERQLWSESGATLGGAIRDSIDKTGVFQAADAARDITVLDVVILTGLDDSLDHVRTRLKPKDQHST